MKLRRAIKAIKTDKPDGRFVITGRHCIEVFHNRRWRIATYENGEVIYFDTAEACLAAISKLNKGEAK